MRTACLCLALAASTAHAQDEPNDVDERDLLVFADLSLGVISAGVEKVVADRVGISFAAGIYGPWYVDRAVDILAPNLEVRLFWYPAGTEAKGSFYVSPGFRFGIARADEDGDTLKGFAFSPRLSAGAHFRFGHFFFRVGVGIQHHNVNLDEGFFGDDYDIHGFFPVLDLYVGAAL